MATIRLTNVQKSYGDHPPVIRRVNLEIAQHEFCVFLGPSGCGKSTLLRMIAGLEDLSEGELHIGGRLVNDVPSAQRGVAMVFQSYALFPHMTVFDNMAFGLKLAKQPKDVIDRKVREAARILQLDSYLDRFPKALSGGKGSVSQSAGPSCANPACSCSMNHSRISTPRCAARRAWKSHVCISALRMRAWST